MLLVLAAVPVGAAHAEEDSEIVYAGKSGAISWSIDREGCLTLSGSGNYETNEWCRYASEIRTAKVEIDQITDLWGMFYGCGLREICLDDWDTSCVTDMEEMFCQSRLTTADLNGLHLENVTNMTGMFAGCMSLTSLKLSDFDTPNLISADGLLNRCFDLTELDMGRVDFSQCEFTEELFFWCGSLSEIWASPHLKAELELLAHKDREWRDESGNVYTHLPKEAEEKVHLMLKPVCPADFR